MDDIRWQRLEAGLRKAAPVAIALPLTVLSAMPPALAAPGPVMPFLPALAVFHWGVWRPDLMPPSAVFAIGLIHDGLTGAPLGLSALALLALRAAAGRRRFFAGRALPAVWLGFALVAAAVAAFSWLAVSLYHLQPAPPAPAAARWGLTVACYPFAAWAFAALQRELPAPPVAPPR